MRLRLVEGEKSAKSLPPLRRKNSETRSREYLTLDEIKDLRASALRVGRYGDRDALLILLMFRHGLRVREAGSLCWDQFHFDDGTMHVTRVKNGTASTHYLEGDEIRALRKLQRKVPTSRFVFSTERRGPITERTIHHIVRRAGEKAGFAFPVHPHMLRHAKGYHLAQRGVDTRSIQAYLGHRDIKSTVIYTALDPSRFRGFGVD
jgi:site-specific recombinase XerD